MTVFTETAAIKLAARESIHRDHYKHHCSTGFDQMRHLPPINSGAYFGDRRSFLATMQACQRKIAKCGMGYDCLYVVPNRDLPWEPTAAQAAAPLA